MADVRVEDPSADSWIDDPYFAHYSWMEPVDLFQEHCDYEANARYDYISEAYGDMIEDNKFEPYYDALDEGFVGSYQDWANAQAALLQSRARVAPVLDDMPF